MKKVLLTILAAFVAFSFTGSVMAKGPKAPKNLCISTSPDYLTFILGTKKGAKIVAGDTKIDMCIVQGIIAGVPAPLIGSGYMDGDIFYFNVSTALTSNLKATGIWDVVNETGILVVNITEEDPTSFTSTQYQIIPCE